MKKIPILLGGAIYLLAGHIQAEFTPLVNGDYQMVITSGCFSFGSCASGGSGEFIDNDEKVESYGTGIAGDGVMGIIDFTIDNGNIIVNSFSQDSYLGTPGGIFAIDITSITGMSGSIDNAGNMIFDPTGRIGIMQFFTFIGAQPWNIDDASNVGTVTGLYEPWTTGTSTNMDPGFGGINDTQTGTPLMNSGPGTWAGTLVSLGNVGASWQFFEGTPYMELYNVKIVGPPVPGIIVSLDVSGGNLQECSETGGSKVDMTADVTLTGGTELASIEWTVNGTSAGSGSSITSFLALGPNTVDVMAVTTTGESDTKSIVVNVEDTTRPVVKAHFIDSRTGELVSSIDSSRTRFVTTSIVATDICDAQPNAYGVVTPTYGVNDGDTIQIQGNNQMVDLSTSALHMSATAVDASGNTGNGQAIMFISD